MICKLNVTVYVDVPDDTDLRGAYGVIVDALGSSGKLVAWTSAAIADNVSPEEEAIILEREISLDGWSDSR